MYRSYSSFVRNDYAILSDRFLVERFEWRGKRDLLRLARAVRRNDVTFSWFASDHAALAVFFSRRFERGSIVVVGGGDVARVPEIRYGTFAQSWHRRALTRYALRRADWVLPVSRFTEGEVLQRARPKRMQVVYNGVDVEAFRPAATKEDLVVTIGGATERTMKLKGHDTFAKASRRVPGCRFVLIGHVDDAAAERLKVVNPDLVMTGHIPQEEVANWLGRAKVYCQLSYRESFGVAVAEAMACGCVPVVTDRGALPEVVGDAGMYVPYGDEHAASAGIQKAMEVHEELGRKARRTIMENFALRRRESQLLALLARGVVGA